MMNTPPFKLLLQSLSLDRQEAAWLLGISLARVKRLCRGAEAVSPEIEQALKSFVQRVDDVAKAFAHCPDRISMADIPMILQDAVNRRIMEINISKEKR